MPPQILTLIAWGVGSGANPRNAARKTALSALRRDWVDIEWSNALQDGVEGTNRLWTQLNNLYGPRLHRELAAIWAEAEKVKADDPANQARARARAWVWIEHVHLIWLPDIERDTLLYVAGEVDRTGYYRVTCPCRAVGAAIGVSHITAWEALGALTDCEMLNRHFRGIWSGNSGQRRAAIYSLADPVKFFGKALVERSLG